MKKQTLLLLTGGMMAFASCSNSANQNPSQAQIDSMVNVKTGEMQATMQASNDSTINAIAKAKADSEIAAQKQNVQSVQTVKVVHEERRDHDHYGDHRDRDHNNNNQGYDQNYNNGYNNPGNAKPVTDRPGATNTYNNNNGNQGNAKPVTDRPGATNTTR